MGNMAQKPIPKFCEECGGYLGTSGPLHVLDGHYVCVPCLNRLTMASAQHSGLGQGSRTTWLWICGAALILAGLGSFRHSPEFLSAPFLIIAGALLLPPGWAWLENKRPVVRGHSNVVRILTCGLAFAITVATMPHVPAPSSSPASTVSPAIAVPPVQATVEDHVGPTRYGDISKMYDDIGPFSEGDGTFKSLPDEDGVKHVQVSGVLLLDESADKDICELRTDQPLVDTIFRTFIHTDENEIIVTSLPMKSDGTTKTPMDSMKKTLRVKRYVVLRILQENAHLTAFSDLVGAEVEGKWIPNLYSKSADGCMYNDQGGVTLKRFIELLAAAN